MTKTTNSPGALTLWTFAAAVLLGGANFVAVRFSNAGLDPFWGAALRFALAATLFVIIAVALRLPWPRGKLLWLTVVYGFFTFTLSYALLYWALVQVTAGMAAVVLAIVPLVTPLLAAMQRLEVLDRRAFLGALVALVGILWMTVSPDGLVLPLAGLIAMVAAAITVGQSVILSKRVSANHPAMTNAVGMSFGVPPLLALSIMAGEAWTLPGEASVVWSVLYLATFGSVGLFVTFLLVVRRWTASASAYAFVLFPVVAMLLEAWLADVPLTLRGITGAVVVMAAVWFGALAPRTKDSGTSATRQAPVAARSG